MLKIFIVLLNLVLGTSLDRNFRFRSLRRRKGTYTLDFSNETFSNYNEVSTITFKNEERISKQVKRVEKYLYALVKKKIIFKKEDLTQNSISALTVVIHYSLYLQTDETLKKFLEKDIPHFTERKNNLNTLILLSPESITENLSKDKFLSKLFNFKFKTSKINRKCRKDPTILEFADKIMSNYILNEKTLDVKKCHSHVCLILYKLKKYYKAPFKNK